MKKGYLWLVGIIAAAFGLTGCKNQISYARYNDAELYTVGMAVFSSDEVKKVEIDWVGGSVEIEQSATTQLSVIEEDGVEKEEEKMRYLRDGNVLKIKYCQAGLRGSVKERDKNLHVVLPAGTSLDLNSTSAVVTMMGSIELSEFSLESVSGNVMAERIVCDNAEIETVSGKVTIGELTTLGFLSGETVSGDFSVTGLFARKLTMETTSGDLFFGIQARIEAEFESNSGEIIVALAEGVGATVRLDTANGELQSEKPYEKQHARYVFAAEEENTCLLDVTTFSGNLKIE